MEAVPAQVFLVGEIGQQAGEGRDRLFEAIEKIQGQRPSGACGAVAGTEFERTVVGMERLLEAAHFQEMIARAKKGGIVPWVAGERRIERLERLTGAAQRAERQSPPFVSRR